MGVRSLERERNIRRDISIYGLREREIAGLGFSDRERNKFWVRVIKIRTYKFGVSDLEKYRYIGG